jgi:hypothetical protein
MKDLTKEDLDYLMNLIVQREEELVGWDGGENLSKDEEDERALADELSDKLAAMQNKL